MKIIDIEDPEYSNDELYHALECKIIGGLFVIIVFFSAIYFVCRWLF